MNGRDRELRSARDAQDGGERDRMTERGQREQRDAVGARASALLASVLVHRAEDLHGSTNASRALMYMCKTMYESLGVNRTCT